MEIGEGSDSCAKESSVTRWCTKAFLKMMHRGDNGSLRHEIENVSGRPRRVSRGVASHFALIGSDVKDETGLVYGLLLTNVDCGGTYAPLCGVQPETSDTLKDRWIRQIRATFASCTRLDSLGRCQTS